MVYEIQGSAESRYPELFADMEAQLTRLLTTEGLIEERAEIVARAAADHMRNHWGGQAIYIPQGMKHQTRERALALYERYNEANLAELAMEYQISTMTAYRWIRYAREELTRKNQAQLFPEEPQKA